MGSNDEFFIEQPPVFRGLLESGLLAALIVFVGIILINGFADEVLKPKFMGEGLDLAPIMVILSITIWTAVLGPLGAILGIPVTMMVKELVLEADERNAWNARLLGKGGEDRRLIPLRKNSRLLWNIESTPHCIRY